MADTLSLFSCVHPQLMRSTLFRGVGLALLGLTPLIYAGLFLPVTPLNRWGAPLFLLSMLLITWGLLPYRKLTRLEKKPDQLLIQENGTIEYYVRGILQLSMAQDEIDHVSYFHSPSKYGIALWRKASKQEISPLFFPYFSERSYRELESLLEPKESPGL